MTGNLGKCNMPFDQSSLLRGLLEQVCRRWQPPTQAPSLCSMNGRRWVLAGYAGYSPGTHQKHPAIPKDRDHQEPWVHAGYVLAGNARYLQVHTRKPPQYQRTGITGNQCADAGYSPAMPGTLQVNTRKTPQYQKTGTTGNHGHTLGTRRPCRVLSRSTPGKPHSTKRLGSLGTMGTRWVLAGSAGHTPGTHQENPTIPKDRDHCNPLGPNGCNFRLAVGPLLQRGRGASMRRGSSRQACRGSSPPDPTSGAQPARGPRHASEMSKGRVPSKVEASMKVPAPLPRETPPLTVLTKSRWIPSRLAHSVAPEGDRNRGGRSFVIEQPPRDDSIRWAPAPIVVERTIGPLDGTSAPREFRPSPPRRSSELSSPVPFANSPTGSSILS